MPMLAASMARFIAGLNLTILPSEVAEKVKVCLLNAYGIGLNGYDTPYAAVARAAAVALDHEVAGGATLLGDGRRTTIGDACLANSALFHGRAQEDTCGAAHFGTVLVPLLTAMIETRHYPLERRLPALVAGYEAGGLLCIATTLIHGVPDMRAMTTYHDATVNDLVTGVELISDNAIPVLSAIIEVETTDGRVLRRNQHMTAAACAYDRTAVSTLVRGIGAKQDLPLLTFDLLEKFVEQLPDGSVDDVLASYAMLPAAARVNEWAVGSRSGLEPR